MIQTFLRFIVWIWSKSIYIVSKTINSVKPINIGSGPIYNYTPTCNHYQPAMNDILSPLSNSHLKQPVGIFS